MRPLAHARALVLQPTAMPGTQIVRRLAALGAVVEVAASNPWVVAARSKHCHGFTLLPSMTHEPLRFLDVVCELARRFDVVLPENAKACAEYEPVPATVSPWARKKVGLNGENTDRVPAPRGAFRLVPSSAPLYAIASNGGGDGPKSVSLRLYAAGSATRSLVVFPEAMLSKPTNTRESAGPAFT